MGADGRTQTPTSKAVQQRRLVALAVVCVLLLGAALLISSLVRDDDGDKVQSRARTVGTANTGQKESTTGRSSGSTDSTGSSKPEATAAPAPTPSKSGVRSFTMLFAGDLLPHGPLNRQAAQFGQASGQPHDFDPLLEPMKPLISSADLAICHMETPVAPNQQQITTYPVFGAPVGLVKAIHDVGYDGCSTASNHSLDKGKAGIAATVAAFDALGLGHTGTYVSAKDATRIQMYDVKGVKVAHLSYSYGFNGIPIPADAPYAVHEIDEQRILAEAKRARAAGAQFVVLSLHWGNEYQPVPNAQQLALSPKLAASPDIDLVVGHHVHVVQPIVRENGKFVLFGLGNQLSNQHADVQRDGLTVLITVTRQRDDRYAATEVRCIPTFVDKPALRVYPVKPALADPSTPAGLRSQLQASFDRTMAVVNSRGATPGVVAYDPAQP